MNCPNCGAPIGPNEKFCTSCGAAVQNQAGGAQAQYGSGQTQQAYQQTYQQSYQQPYTQPGQVYTAPQPQQPSSQYKLLSPWAYFGYNILFAIPIVGFILLIVFSLSDSNLNRRNYARSFWCALLIAVIVFVILLVLSLIFRVPLTDYLPRRYI